MKSRVTAVLLLAMIALPGAAVLQGCAMGNTAIAQETGATLDKRLVVGTTRKEDVLKMYGEPSEKAVSNGREVWTYRTVDTSFRSYVPFVGLAMGKNGTESTNLVITFERSGLVAGHELIKF